MFIEIKTSKLTFWDKFFSNIFNLFFLYFFIYDYCVRMMYKRGLMNQDKLFFYPKKLRDDKAFKN